MSAPDPGFLAGIDPASVIATDLEADFHAAAEAAERAVIGDGKPHGFDGLLAALGDGAS